ncbi:hypothetical protein LTR28_000919 [Elasticomyces elasticus]|nr:hypothetical protein LTR28_000919 [Elasticomyces elasticus]
MTGVFSAKVQTALVQLGTGVTAGPATENNVGNNAAGAAGPDAGAFTIPYTLQTGLTRYAPMQPVPPTKITAKTPTPLYPTSAYVIATTWLPIPTILKTVTASQTFSVKSMENTAAPAAMPSNDMAKFLARWKD